MPQPEDLDYESGSDFIMSSSDMEDMDDGMDLEDSDLPDEPSAASPSIVSINQKEADHNLPEPRSDFTAELFHGNRKPPSFYRDRMENFKFEKDRFRRKYLAPRTEKGMDGVLWEWRAYVHLLSSVYIC